MTGRRAVHVRPVAAARSVSVEEAVREIRRQASRIGRARKAMKALLESIDLPTEAEIRQMRERRCPLSREAHLIGAVRRAVADLETCEAGLRLAVEKRMLDRLDKEWQRGWCHDTVELQHIETAVAALRKEARGRR